MILDKRIPVTYWIGIIKWDMLTVAVFSTVIRFFTWYFPDTKIPMSLGTFLGTAIALLLSFRLSQSYGRWWEARKIWGAIVNDSRTLVIQLKSFSSGKEKELLHKMAYRQIAWCYSLGQGLRNQNPLENTDSFISANELESIKHHKNIPLALLDNHSRDLASLLREKQIDVWQQVQIDTTLKNLCSSMGQAERIKNTAFPRPYRLTLRLFIYIFLILLSFSLSEVSNVAEIPLLVVISIPFFLLDKISHEIEDPFENRPSDTAMTTIAKTVEINIKQLIGKASIPEPLSSNTYYIL
jgi:putative membrane protein